MSRTLIFDSNGNEITPMCEIADGIILDDGHGECIYKSDCACYGEYARCSKKEFEMTKDETIEVLQKLRDGAEEVMASSDPEDREVAEHDAAALTAAISMIQTRVEL